MNSLVIFNFKFQDLATLPMVLTVVDSLFVVYRTSLQQQVQMLYAQAPPPMGPPGTGMAAARPAAPPGNPNDPWNKGANILNFS